MHATFVSFDYENDKHYKRLIEAWDKNPAFSFSFDDRSSQEIQSDDVGRVKAALSRKINTATHTLAIIGRYANQQHEDYRLIGYKNWINFEIAKSKECGNKLVAIKIDKSYESPEELLNSQASWAMVFEQEPILTAIRNAR